MGAQSLDAHAGQSRDVFSMLARVVNASRIQPKQTAAAVGFESIAATITKLQAPNSDKDSDKESGQSRDDVAISIQPKTPGEPDPK